MSAFASILVFGSACKACVRFDGVPPATVWGNPPPTEPPGTLVHTEEDINVTVENFLWAGSGGTFNRAHPDAPFASASGQSLRTNNINMAFDFSGLSFTPKKVTLDFKDMGGNENISVNGSTIAKNELASGSGGGVSWIVSSSPITGGRQGTVTITGNVQKLLIGGQEFWIDNVCAHR
ncbi:MAG: hypothetical protein ACE10D_09545 [Planctomycetota bacterium]